MRHPVSGPAAVLAGLAGASAVAFGAFGAHALRGVLDAHALEIWHTGVEYHFWHALALLVVMVGLPAGRARTAALAAFGAGIVLFSGSLYALALGAPTWTGAITPLGGVAFIGGWVFASAGLRKVTPPV